MAGSTGAVVVLPQGIAFASIAGMPPEFGLYSAMIPAIVAALFGSSPQLVSGPTIAASMVLFSSSSALAVPASADYVRLALTLTFRVGVIELVLGLARLGVRVNFVSPSVPNRWGDFLRGGQPRGAAPSDHRPETPATEPPRGSGP